MYTDSINQFNGMSVVSGLSNVCICGDAIGDPKEIIIPNGFNPLTDNYIAIKAVFLNGHNAVNDSTYLTVKCKYSNGDYVQDGADVAQIPIMANKDGSLINIPIHTMDVSGTTTYKVLQPNTVLEMYYDPNANGGNGVFVVIGNPIVLSANDSNSSYTVYANGSVGDAPIGAIRIFSGNIEPYGYFFCDGREISRVIYNKLFDIIGTTYGSGDESTTFNIPNTKDRFIQGANENLGNYIDAGLPNIIGSVAPISNIEAEATGAFYRDGHTERNKYWENDRGNGRVRFNASSGECNLDGTLKTTEYKVYGKSDTVQPPSIVMNYIIKYL